MRLSSPSSSRQDSFDLTIFKFLSGKYWESVSNAFHCETSPLHVIAKECMNHVVSISKNVHGDDGWLDVLFYCRLADTAKCEPFRKEIREGLKEKDIRSYANVLMKQFLNPASKSKIGGFESIEILKDLKTLASSFDLGSKLLFRIVEFLVAAGLFRFVDSKKLSAKLLEKIRTSKIERTEELRRHCLTCLMHIYSNLNPAQNAEESEGTKISKLGQALKSLSFQGVHIFQDLSEEAKEKFETMESLSRVLESELEQETPSKMESKAKALHDLFSVMRLYFYAHEGTVNTATIEELSRVVAMHFGSVEDEEETESKMDVETDLEEEERSMNVWINVVIDLCMRRTEPFPVGLMTKYVKRAFIAFSDDLDITAWIQLLNVLTDIQAFQIEQDDNLSDSEADPEALSDPADDEEDVAMERRSTEDSEDVEMGDDGEWTGTFDASTLETKKAEDARKAQIKRKFEEDLNSGSGRVLALVNYVLRKHSRKGFTAITPLYLVRAISIHGDPKGETEERWTRSFELSLSCKPDVQIEDLSLIQEEAKRFMEGLSRKETQKTRISKAVSFLVTRLRCCPKTECQELAVEIMKDVMTHMFTKRSAVMVPEDAAALLSQHHDLSRGVLPHILDLGRKTKRVPLKLKAMEFASICFKDKDETALASVLNGSEIGEFLKEVLQVEVGGKRFVQLLQGAGNVLVTLRRLSGGRWEPHVPIKKLRSIVKQRMRSEKASKFKKKASKFKKRWSQLDDLLSKP